MHGRWGQWSSCSKSCNGGTMSRRRSVIKQAQCGGRPCGGPSTEVQRCNEHPCPTTRTCGKLHLFICCITKYYIVLKINISISSVISYHFSIIIMFAAVDCQWDCWSEWGPCDCTCGGGTKTRTRRVKIPAQGCGRPCFGLAKETDRCNEHPCPQGNSAQAYTQTDNIQ